MKLVFLIFLIIFSTILFGAHFSFYWALIKFFQIKNTAIKNILFYLTIVLSFSFAISSFLVRVKPNTLTKIVYYISSLWHGTLINLLLACLLTLLLFLFIKNTPHSSVLPYVFGANIFIALVFSIYGAWNAQNIIVKNLNIKIKNLPIEWQGKTLIHLSDVHAGIIIDEKFIEKVIAKVNQERPDLVLITGDYFDGTYNDLTKLAAPLKKINSANGVFFVRGNHESYVLEDNNHLKKILENNGVNYLSDEKKEVDGLDIIGIDYNGYQQAINEKEISKLINNDHPTILLTHEPTLINFAQKNNIDLQLAGHTHAGQQFPFKIFTYLFYGKYHNGLNTVGDYKIYTTNGVGTWGPPLRIGNHPEIIKITLTSK